VTGQRACRYRGRGSLEEGLGPASVAAGSEIEVAAKSKAGYLCRLNMLTNTQVSAPGEVPHTCILLRYCVTATSGADGYSVEGRGDLDRDGTFSNFRLLLRRDTGRDGRWQVRGPISSNELE